MQLRNGKIVANTMADNPEERQPTLTNEHQQPIETPTTVNSMFQELLLQFQNLQTQIKTQGENLTQIAAQGENLQIQITTQGENLQTQITAQGENVQTQVRTQGEQLEKLTQQLQEHQTKIYEHIHKQEQTIEALSIGQTSLTSEVLSMRNDVHDACQEIDILNNRVTQLSDSMITQEQLNGELRTACDALESNHTAELTAIKKTIEENVEQAAAAHGSTIKSIEIHSRELAALKEKLTQSQCHQQAELIHSQATSHESGAEEMRQVRQTHLASPQTNYSSVAQEAQFSDMHAIPMHYNLLNEIPVPQFNDTQDNAKRYIMDLEVYFNLKQVPESLKLLIIEKGLQGRALSWFRLAIGGHASYEEFKNLFLTKYWNNTTQYAVRIKINNGKYTPGRGQHLIDYFLDLAQQSLLLDPPMCENEFVQLIVRHFPDTIRNNLIVARAATIAETLDLLTALQNQQVENNENRTSGVNFSGLRAQPTYQYRRQQPYQPRERPYNQTAHYQGHGGYNYSRQPRETQRTHQVNYVRVRDNRRPRPHWQNTNIGTHKSEENNIQTRQSPPRENTNNESRRPGCNVNAPKWPSENYNPRDTHCDKYRPSSPTNRANSNRSDTPTQEQNTGVFHF